MERESDTLDETEAALGCVTEALGSFGAADTEDGVFLGIHKKRQWEITKGSSNTAKTEKIVLKDDVVLKIKLSVRVAITHGGGGVNPQAIIFVASLRCMNLHVPQCICRL